MTSASRTLVLAAAAAIAGGCSTFYDESLTEAGTRFEQTVITFDSSLPEALEDFFASCHSTMRFSPSSPDLDLGGSCDALSDLPTAEAQLVWLGLAATPPIDLSDAFPAGIEDMLFEVYHFVDPLPWPLQNCDIFIDLQLDVHGLSLNGFGANWITRNGEPALHADLDHTPAAFASGPIDGDVDCPNPLNEPAVQGSLPNGFHSIRLSNVDLDAWIKFDWSGANVTASVEVEAQIDAITISPALSSRIVDNIGDIETILEDQAGISRTELVADVEAAVADALGAVAAEAEKQLEAAVPDGYVICEIEVAGGQLIMRTEQTTCLDFVIGSLP
jgi:hypothetical protein